MERNNDWNSRRHEKPYPHQDRREERMADEDSYRSSYRMDNSSPPRNESTWNDSHRAEDRRRSSTDYNRNYNRDYNNDYNRNYNDMNRSGSSGRRDDYRRNGSQGYQQGAGQQRHGSVHDRIVDQDPYGSGNFSADYRPDRYGRGGGENYGNMAGSLSYGYDGNNISDPDWNSRYEPMTGKRRSYHGNYESRHPDYQRFRENDNSRHDDAHRDNSNDWY
ncbi:hypothetical protein ACXYMU_08730 [Pontibacter sp. CAU 1760]